MILGFICKKKVVARSPLLLEATKKEKAFFESKKLKEPTLEGHNTIGKKDMTKAIRKTQQGQQEGQHKGSKDDTTRATRRTLQGWKEGLLIQLKRTCFHI
jgi:hypothetical protein